MVLRAGSNGEASYEVLARIDLPPGRYQLRLAAHNGTSGRDGSVFADVTVPDYSNLPFSASPIVLSATPGRQSAPKDLLTPLLPFVPTAEREFAKTDKVTSFLRLYQSGQKPVEAVNLSIRVRDSADQVKVDEKQTIAVARFTGIEPPVETVNGGRSTTAASRARHPDAHAAGAGQIHQLRAANRRHQIPGPDRLAHARRVPADDRSDAGPDDDPAGPAIQREVVS